MSYYFWLGKDAERLLAAEQDKVFFRNEIIARQAECKPEADGWVTLYPEVRK